MSTMNLEHNSKRLGHHGKVHQERKMKPAYRSNGKWTGRIFRLQSGRRRLCALLAVLLLGTGVCSTAAAEHYHHRTHVGVYVGPGWGWYYPPPVYYPPVVVAAPAEPPVYIEKEPEIAVPSATPAMPGYWYYCHKPDGYYPYVKECPGGWQRVTPQPPPPQH
jgi:hypothetical protein